MFGQTKQTLSSDALHYFMWVHAFIRVHNAEKTRPLSYNENFRLSHVPNRKITRAHRRLSSGLDVTLLQVIRLRI